MMKAMITAASGPLKFIAAAPGASAAGGGSSDLHRVSQRASVGDTPPNEPPHLQLRLVHVSDAVVEPVGHIRRVGGEVFALGEVHLSVAAPNWIIAQPAIVTQNCQSVTVPENTAETTM
jgi:hypothetical protein